MEPVFHHLKHALGFNQAASTTIRRRWELPALVMPPWDRREPLQHSRGTRPA